MHTPDIAPTLGSALFANAPAGQVPGSAGAALALLACAAAGLAALLG